jgi:hypothetical protein
VRFFETEILGRSKNMDEKYIINPKNVKTVYSVYNGEGC